jgi:purine catabolism regulator
VTNEEDTVAIGALKGAGSVASHPDVFLGIASGRDSVFPTIDELLRMPDWDGVQLLSCQSSAAQRRIRRTSVQELPLDDFVRAGELVMTTGIGLTDVHALTTFVQDIARAGAAGLAFAIGPHVKELPARVVMEAERLGLPLFVFPWELRFSETAELILGRIVDRQHAWLRRSDEIHQLFTGIVLGGGNLERLCRFAEHALSRAVRVVNRWGEPTDAGPDSLAAREPTGWHSQVVRVPITADHRQLGSIDVAASEPLTELDAMIAGHAATAAALIMLMEQAADDGEARGQSELVVSILSGSGASQRELERRAISLGFDPTKPFVVLSMSFSGPDSTDEALAEVGRWAISRALGARRLTALQAWDGADVTLLVPVDRSTAGPIVRGMVDDVGTFARRYSPEVLVDCGIGRVAPRLAEVLDSFREAVTANRLGSRLNGPGSTTEHGMLGAYPALHEAMNAPGSSAAFADLHERYLGVAERYEREAGLPLLATLAMYFAQRGNVSATARELRINRQSLLYRLERFQVLSNVDLGSPMDRFALELAVRMWRIRSGDIQEAQTRDRKT